MDRPSLRVAGASPRRGPAETAGTVAAIVVARAGPTFRPRRDDAPRGGGPSTVRPT